MEKKMIRAKSKLVSTQPKVAGITYACGTGGASVGGERGTGWQEK